MDDLDGYNSSDGEIVFDGERNGILDCDESLEEEEVQTSPLQGLYDLQERAARFVNHPALSIAVTRYVCRVHLNLGGERSMSLSMEFPTTACFREDPWVTNVILHLPQTSMVLIDDENIQLEEFINVITPVLRNVFMLIE